MPLASGSRKVEKLRALDRSERSHLYKAVAIYGVADNASAPIQPAYLFTHAMTS